MTAKGRIAVFSLDAKLGREVRGATRYTFLATLLASHGYEVDFVTSSFQHWDKEPRDVEHFDAATDAYRIQFIEEPGYPKNMCPQRIWSHHVAASRAAEFFEEHHDYQLIYCQIPPNDITRAIGRVARRHGIPFVVDVNDLWPEAFRVALDVPVVSDILFAPFERQACDAYALASAIVGTSDEYSARGFKDRAADVPRLTVYVGNDLDEFDAGVAAHAREVEKPADEFWLIYAGTMSANYDLGTLIQAVARIQQTEPRVKLKLLGDGPAREGFEQVARESGADVDFLGYQPYDAMAAWLAASDVTVNSLIAKAAQSIVTKIGDYLAAGIPMINTSLSPEFSAKVEADGFGVNVQPEDVDALERVIMELLADADGRVRMGKIARRIAEEQFDRKHSYVRIVELIDSLVE